MTPLRIFFNIIALSVIEVECRYSRSVYCYDPLKQCFHYNDNCGGSDYTGNHSKTLSGRDCQMWSSQSPHKHTHSAEKNICRDPTYNRPGPWCYTSEKARQWEYCLKDCSAPVCFNAARQCFHNGVGCMGEQEYTGYKNTTVSGRVCQAWSEQSPHNHTNGRIGDTEGNYCRNPDGSPGPWCYTTDKDKRFELCFKECDELPCPDPPKLVNGRNTASGQQSGSIVSYTCDKGYYLAKETGERIPDMESSYLKIVCTKDGEYSLDIKHFRCEPHCYDPLKQCFHYGAPGCEGSYYTGNHNKTLSGRDCQAWSSQSPHEHSSFGQKNTCSDPTLIRPGPWCYTSEKARRWEYCLKDCSAPVCFNAARQCFHNGGGCMGEQEYKGYKNTTVHGLVCQAWSKQSPHYHSNGRIGDTEANYCRNPDGEPAPWCYTTNKDKRLEFCFEECKALPCRAPPELANGSKDKSGEQEPRSLVIYTCNKGYSLAKETGERIPDMKALQVVCTRDGEYSYNIKHFRCVVDPTSTATTTAMLTTSTITTNSVSEPTSRATTTTTTTTVPTTRTITTDSTADPTSTAATTTTIMQTTRTITTNSAFETTSYKIGWDTYASSGSESPGNRTDDLAGCFLLLIAAMYMLYFLSTSDEEGRKSI